jgi:hypothetical protein
MLQGWLAHLSINYGADIFVPHVSPAPAAQPPPLYDCFPQLCHLTGVI